MLLLTNDTSVGIRSLGMCDDLQRVNDIDDRTWRTVYEPQRPMVLTMDDLKLLDTYMRQYYYLSTAAGRTWMQDAQQREPVVLDTPLQLWLEGFRPGSRKEQGARGKEQGAKGKEQESKATPTPDRRDAPPAPERSEEQQKQKPANGNRKQEQGARGKEHEALAEEHPATDSEAKDNPSERDSLPSKEGEGVSATEETAAPEAKKSRSRRGGRGRRGKKSNAENA